MTWTDNNRDLKMAVTLVLAAIAALLLLCVTWIVVAQIHATSTRKRDQVCYAQATTPQLVEACRQGFAP